MSELTGKVQDRGNEAINLVEGVVNDVYDEGEDLLKIGWQTLTAIADAATTAAKKLGDKVVG